MARSCGSLLLISSSTARGFAGGRQAAAENLPQEVLPHAGQVAGELRARARLPAVAGRQVGDGSANQSRSICPPERRVRRVTSFSG
jgi:hypothetical protein